MATIAELTASIHEVAEDRGIEAPDLDGLNHAGLTAVLKELRAEPKAEPEAKPEAKATPEPEAKAEFVVAKGKAITSPRGILAEGDEITAADLSGGADAIDEFVRSGHIVAG